MSYNFEPENPFKTEQSEVKTVPGEPKSGGLRIEHFFSTPDEHPFEQLEWEDRSVRITGDGGQAVFEQDNIEVPVSWSQLATKVVASKYFYGDVTTGLREHSVKQLVHRVCKMIADRGKRDGYFATDEDGSESGAVDFGGDTAAKEFGKFLQSKHLAVSKACSILGIKSLAEITDYKKAHDDIMKELEK